MGWPRAYGVSKWVAFHGIHVLMKLNVVAVQKYRPLQQVVYAFDIVAEKIKATLYKPAVTELGLFGSFRRGSPLPLTASRLHTKT
jgi:hypothetical protein